MKKLILITLFSIGIYGMNSQNYEPCNSNIECDESQISSMRHVSNYYPGFMGGSCNVTLSYDVIECNGNSYASNIEWLFWNGCVPSQSDQQAFLNTLQLDWVANGNVISLKNACRKIVKVDIAPLTFADLAARGCSNLCGAENTDPSKVLMSINCNEDICCNYTLGPVPAANGGTKDGVQSVTTSGPCDDNGNHPIGSTVNLTFNCANGRTMVPGTIVEEYKGCSEWCGWVVSTGQNVAYGGGITTKMTKAPTANKDYSFILEGKALAMENPDNLIGVFVFDLNGKLLKREEKSFSNINLNDLNSNQIYLMRYVTKDNQVKSIKFLMK